MIAFPNLRIRSQSGMVYGTWFCDPDDKEKVAYAKKILAEIQAEEPNYGWRLECRGQSSDWHEWKD